MVKGHLLTFYGLGVFSIIGEKLRGIFIFKTHGDSYKFSYIQDILLTNYHKSIKLIPILEYRSSTRVNNFWIV